MNDQQDTWRDLFHDHLATMLARCEQSLQESGKEGLLISSGELHTAFLDDRTYPFISNPHFRALVPVKAEPGCFVRVIPGEKPTLYYHQPRDYWHLAPADPEGYWTDEFDIQIIGSPEELHNHAGDLRALHFIGEPDERIAGLSGTVNDSAVLASLHFDRARKTPYEIACMAEANRIAARGHKAAEIAFRNGASEFAIQQTYLAAIRSREQQTPYSSIVALNEHAAVLHYQHYDLEAPEVHRSFLIDAGADFAGYAADITRTHVAADGTFADLVENLDKEQQALINDIRPGDDYVSLHQQMNHRLANILKTFGIVEMNVDDMVDQNVTFHFFPHGLGHLLGLQTHDVGGFQQDRKGSTRSAPEAYPALRLTRSIDEGHAFTIEPGLYFIDLLLAELRDKPAGKHVNWDLVEQLKPWGGIRIEDNIVISGGTPRNLTREAFREVAND